jgi:hypothetical protein
MQNFKTAIAVRAFYSKIAHAQIYLPVAAADLPDWLQQK